mgnify:CR=1 FL=1
MFGFSVFLFHQLMFDWWWYLLLFFAPDLGFIGYAVNSRIGAFLYNILHHKGIALCLYGIGVFLNDANFQLVGIVFFGHAAFDRALGYGLKHSDSFNNTHLGKIGKK